MEHGAIRDRGREIGRVAAIRRLLEDHRFDQAIPGKPDVVVDAKAMALAGQHHVDIAIEAELDGPSGFRRSQSGQARNTCSLGLLTAEPAAHSPDFHRHLVIENTECFRHQMLDFARMLGRAHDRHVSTLAGDGEGDLAFQIKMILPADPKSSRQAMRRRVDCSFRLAALHLMRREDESFLLHGLIDGEDRIKGRGFDLGQQSGASCLQDCVSDHQEQRLTGIVDPAVSK